MIRKIQHIGIAVRSLQEAIPFYRDVLGLSLVGTGEGEGSPAHRRDPPFGDPRDADRLPPPEVDLRRPDGVRGGRGRGRLSMPCPAPPRHTLLLCIHTHQPVGNFESVLEGAARDAYLPFLRTLAAFPSVKVTLHFAGL